MKERLCKLEGSSEEFTQDIAREEKDQQERAGGERRLTGKFHDSVYRFSERKRVLGEKKYLK